jgi:large subunit ribosomal protein L18
VFTNSHAIRLYSHQYSNIMKITKKKSKIRRKVRVRGKVFGTSKMPRLNVFRSLKYISAQLINDEKGITLVAADDKKLKGNNIEKAKEVGKQLAEKALDKKIKNCVFDKSSYKYHGRVKALAEGARGGGLKF